MSSNSANNQQRHHVNRHGAAAGSEAFTTDEAVLRVDSGTEAAAGTEASQDGLYSDLAYWQTRAFDLQSDISNLENQREQRRKQSLDQIK